MKVASILPATKRFLVSLICMLTIGTTLIFANDKVKLTDRVQESFKKEFSGAQFVNWAETSEYFKATFVLGGHRAEAYFTRDGELQGSIRDLFFDQMPLSVMTAFDKRFANASILDVREVTNSEGTKYLVTLELQEKKYHVKADAQGDLSEIEKEKK